MSARLDRGKPVEYRRPLSATERGHQDRDAVRGSGAQFHEHLYDEHLYPPAREDEAQHYWSEDQDAYLDDWEEDPYDICSQDRTYDAGKSDARDVQYSVHREDNYDQHSGWHGARRKDHDGTEQGSLEYHDDFGPYGGGYGSQHESRYAQEEDEQRYLRHGRKLDEPHQGYADADDARYQRPAEIGDRRHHLRAVDRDSAYRRYTPRAYDHEDMHGVEPRDARSLKRREVWARAQRTVPCRGL